MQLLNKMALLLCSVTVMSGCAPGRTAFDKAQKFELSGDLDQAVVKYAEATTDNPDISEYRLQFLKASSAAAVMHLKKGDDALAANRLDDALREYQTASVLDPSEARAIQQSDVVKKLRLSQIIYREGADFEKSNKFREALRSYKKALEFNSANKEAREGVERIVKAHQIKDGHHELNLKSTKPITLKFKDAKIKDIFNIITKLSGINFIFDDAVKDTNFSIYLENASFQQAFDVITELNKLDKKILNENTIILYPKTPEKRKQYEELYLQTFYLNKLDAKKAINLLRTMMQIKKIYVNEELNALVIRDTPDVVELAGKILEANDIPDAEVVLEVEVIELSKTNADSLGTVLSRYAISAEGTNNGSPFADSLGSSTSTPTTGTATTPSNLLQMFAWKQFGGFLTVPNATFNFGKTLTNGETLSNPKIRVKNREKAKFNVGTRVPITTTSSPVGGGTTVNVQYVDVGVKLNAEPTIQLNNEISIKVGMEVSSILSRDSSSGTSVVTIGTRNLDTVLSLKDGETSIIGGLIQDQKSNGKQTIALLGDIPILGSLFSNKDTNNNKTELILAITPRIVRSIVVPDPSVAAFWTGKEDEPSTVKLYSSFAEEPELSPVAEAPSAPVKGFVAAPAQGTPAGAAVSVIPQHRRPSGAVTQESITPPPILATAPKPAPVPMLTPPPASVAAPAAARVQQANEPHGQNEQQNDKILVKLSAPQRVSVNKAIFVNVDVENLSMMKSAVLVIDCDPALAGFIQAGPGSMLNNSVTVKADQSQDKSRITLNITNTGVGISGSGNMVQIAFKANAKGVLSLKLDNASAITAENGKLENVSLAGTTVAIQ